MENSFRISSGAVSDRGLSEKRPENEDSYLEIPQCGIYAVADGVGGAQAGEVASQMAMEILGEAFTNFPEGSDAESVMRTAMERANAAIFEMAHELPQLASMATTIVALHLADSIATIGHVGDSRLYRVDRDGNLHRETEDHSMVAEEVRAGRMTEEQAENHPSRNIISRALGAELNVNIDLKTIMVEPGTAFLICSDGITRHIGDPEIKGVLTFGGAPVEICEYLKGLCYERGAEDNLTAVVVKVAAGEAGAMTAESEHLTVEAEEETVATARVPLAPPMADDDDNALLEIEAREFMEAASTAEKPEDHHLGDVTLAFHDAETVELDEGTAPAFDSDQTSSAETGSAADPTPEPRPLADDNFSIFGDSGGAEVEQQRSGSVAGKIAAAFGMLLLGGIIGLGVYHFVLVPRLPEVTGNPLSEMKSENIPFTSFEKNRRNVDADPAAYLTAVPPPEDAEGFYLFGRANLLAGDFPRARLAFIEAQKRLKDADSVNARILATDIATALFVTNDPTMQGRLKNEIEASLRMQSNSNVNANR